MKDKKILAILFLGLLSFKPANFSDDFKIKTETFLKKYEKDYSNSNETLPANGYQRTLDETKHSWIKKETLKSKKSFINLYDQVAYQRLYFAFYEYPNEETAKAAWNRLATCFPLMCDSVITRKYIKVLQTIPAVYIFNNSEIITCHVSCEQEFENWKNIQEDIVKTFSDSLSKVIITGCGGPLEWKQF